MAKTSTGKKINLGQLAAEMNNAPLNARSQDGTTDIFATTVDQATLDAAVAAHVAVDEDANADTLRNQAVAALQANRDFLAVTSSTNAQVASQVKALTRQNNGVIRLLLGKLDGTN